MRLGLCSAAARKGIDSGTQQSILWCFLRLALSRSFQRGPEEGNCYTPLKWLAVPLVWEAWEALYVDWWPQSRLSGSVLKPGLMWQTCKARST